MFTEDASGFKADPSATQLKFDNYARPRKHCIAPNGNILLPITSVSGVVEMTSAGAIVRHIGPGVLSAPVWSVASSSCFIAMGLFDASRGDQLFLLSWPSGEFVRSFGPPGAHPGQLDGCIGMRFTPDGARIVIAEQTNNRVSMFSLEGVLMRIFLSDVLYPRDVEFAPNGDLIVADYGHNLIKVYSMAPGEGPPTLLRTFGKECGLDLPTALALHNRKRYVLCQGAPRVEVFA